MEGSQAANQIPSAPAVKRYKFFWRVFLIFNFGLGAYMFAQAGKKERGKEKSVAPAEVTPSPATPTVPTLKEPAFSPPTQEPVVVRQPIPEDRQRELFTWMLEEKRKLKPQNREEKHKIDEEKAILKEFIHSKSLPSI